MSQVATYQNQSIPTRGLISVSDSCFRCFVWEDIVGEDELRRDLTDHSEHRVVLLIFVSKLLPQLLLELNLVEALGILSGMNMS